MTFRERYRLTDEDGKEYVNILQVESGYDRNIPAVNWDADPKLESAKIADYLARIPPTPVIVVSVKPGLTFTTQELTDALAGDAK